MAEATEEKTSVLPAPGEASPKFDARLAEGVSYFEQMLEIMPEDRTTLEFLVVAYAQLGEREKGQKALVSLTKLLIKEKDVNALAGLIPWLEASDNDTAKALLLKVKMMTAPEPDLTPEQPKELTEKEKVAFAVIDAVKSELALVEHLQSGGVLSDEEAEQVRDQLQVSSAGVGGIFLVSALQILEKENKPKCDRALEFLADKYATPPVPLAAFDVPKQMFDGYPEIAARLRGVVPFAKVGNVTLIATLNPEDKDLRTLFEAVGPCRFFLADPAMVEAALAKVFEKKEGK